MDIGCSMARSLMMMVYPPILSLASIHGEACKREGAWTRIGGVAVLLSVPEDCET